MSKSEQNEEREGDWRELLKLFRSVQDPDLQEELFTLFFTMNERKMLNDRYRIVKALLMTSLSQREIADQLKVSITKMTDGSKALQIISDKFKNYLVNEMREEK